MVAGGSGDDAFLSLRRRQLADLIIGAPEFKGAGILEILRLEVDGAAGYRGEERAFDKLRLDGDAVELLGGAENIGDGGCGDEIGRAFFIGHKEASPMIEWR